MTNLLRRHNTEKPRLARRNNSFQTRMIGELAISYSYTAMVMRRQASDLPGNFDLTG